MRIAAITNLYPPQMLGGYEWLCEKTVDSLKERGHEVLVLTSKHGLVKGVEYPVEDGVKRLFDVEHPLEKSPEHVSLRRRASVSRSNTRKCRAELEAFRPHVSCVWNVTGLSLGPALAAEEFGVPQVFFQFNNHLTRYRPRKFAGGPLRLFEALSERSWCKGLTVEALSLGRSLFISGALRDQMADIGFPVSHAKTYCPGVDLERFPLKPDPRRIHHPARLLCMGPLHPNRRIEILLRSLSSLHESPRTRVSLTVAGDGDEDYIDELKHVAEDLGVAGDTLFAPGLKIDMIPQFYRDHDIFVCAATWDDAFGMTHLEAMASGCPIVSTDCGGPTEFLRHDQNALIVQKDHPAELAGAIKRLLPNAVLRGNLIDNARKVAESRFGAKVCLDELEEYLLKAAGK